jgi:hypothetical protein
MEMFLTLDHVDGGGTKHMAEVRAETGGAHIYSWLHKHGYPEGFQVLCMNCNWGRYRNGGVCPHELMI